LASPHDFRVKGTDKFLYALAKVETPFELKTINYGKDAQKARVLAEKLGLKVKFIDKVPHEKMNELYWEADLVLGSFGVGQLDTVAIEAMACGRPVIQHIKSEYYSKCPLEKLNSIVNCTNLIENFLINKKEVRKRVELQYNYVKSNHAATVLVNKLAEIYKIYYC